MANQEHFDILKQGANVWNKWREENPDTKPNLSGVNLNEIDLGGANLRGADLSRATLNDKYLFNVDFRGASLIEALLIDTWFVPALLSGADLSSALLGKVYLGGADLSGICFRGAYLRGADLTETNLIKADLSRADLGWSDFIGANLRGAKLRETDLSRANLSKADFRETDLRGADLRLAFLIDTSFRDADLRGANLNRAVLIGADMKRANLTGCSIYGISAWDVQLELTIQSNLVITPPGEPAITVDNLEIAQFIYLLLNNQKIRDVIDTITSKVVLILGRFTPERKAILDALRDELRKHNYSPVLFDFEKPANRDFTETVRTLAHLARFIIADLTDPSSIPQELQAIIPDLEVPVQPLLLEAKREYAMLVDFRKYHWVLPVSLYKDLPGLLASLNGTIDAAEKKVAELALEKAKRLGRP